MTLQTAPAWPESPLAGPWR